MIPRVTSRYSYLPGIFAMLLAIALVNISDAATKFVASGYPAGEILFLRSLSAFLLIAGMVWRNGGVAAIRIHDRTGQACRAAATVTGALFSILSLALLPLADVVAIMSSMPIVITGLAVVFLHECISRAMVLSLAIGFAGVLIIVRPGMSAFQWAGLLPLFAVAGFALRDIVTRRMHASEPAISMLFWASAAQLSFGFVSLPFGWVTPSAPDLAWFAVSGIALGGAQYFFIETYRKAPATVVAPYMYTSLIWGAVLGLLLWGHVPDIPTVLGSVLIAAAGLSIFRSERLAASQRA